MISKAFSPNTQTRTQEAALASGYMTTLVVENCRQSCESVATLFAEDDQRHAVTVSAPLMSWVRRLLAIVVFVRAMPLGAWSVVASWCVCAMRLKMPLLVAAVVGVSCSWKSWAARWSILRTSKRRSTARWKCLGRSKNFLSLHSEF